MKNRRSKGRRFFRAPAACDPARHPVRAGVFDLRVDSETLTRSATEPGRVAEAVRPWILKPKTLPLLLLRWLGRAHPRGGRETLAGKAVAVPATDPD